MTSAPQLLPWTGVPGGYLGRRPTGVGVIVSVALGILSGCHLIPAPPAEDRGQVTEGEAMD